LNKLTSSIIKNGSYRYFVISCNDEENPSKLLLQRIPDGEILIAYDVNYDNSTNIYWNKGSYFGRNIVSAAKAFTP
jgi:hypothetical protein